MLMGDIPQRSVFCQKDTRRSLAPYLQLTQGPFHDLCIFSLVFHSAHPPPPEPSSPSQP